MEYYNIITNILFTILLIYLIYMMIINDKQKTIN